MSIKSKALAAAATLTLVGGVGAVGALTAGTASAATPSCAAGVSYPGVGCIDVFNRDFGTHASPNFVVDVLRQGEKVGQPVILFRTSNADPAEDFTVSYSGQVSDLYSAGLVSAATDLHYGGGCAVQANGTPNTVVGTEPNCKSWYPDDFAFELQYAPYGVDSGLCAGVPATAYNDEHVALEPCGDSGKTVWIQDVDNATGFKDSYVPYINGSNNNFSQPYVLDYPANSYPTDMPRPQLIVQQLATNAQNHTVTDTQLWSENWGELR